MNSNKFMMLLALAIGTSSQIKSEAKSCPTEKEHKRIHKMENEIHSIRECIEKNGTKESDYKKLDALDEQAKNLCSSCDLEKNHMCKTHEHTLSRKIDNARKLADKHAGKKKEMKNKAEQPKKNKAQQPKKDKKQA